MSSWGDQPMFGGKKNNQSRIELRWFMTGIGIIFALIMVGEIIPLVETIMTFLIIAIMVTGLVLCVVRRFREANQMYHALYDDLDEEPSILKRVITEDDYTE